MSQHESIDSKNALTHQGLEYIRKDKSSDSEQTESEPIRLQENEDIDRNKEQDIGFISRLCNRLFRNSASTTVMKQKGDELQQQTTLKPNGSPCERWLHFFHSFSMMHHMPIPGPTKICKQGTKEKAKNIKSGKYISLDQNSNDTKNSSTTDEKVEQNSTNQNADRNCIISAISHSSFRQHDEFIHVVDFVYNNDSPTEKGVISTEKASNNLLKIDLLKNGNVEEMAIEFKNQLNLTSNALV